MHRIVEKFYRFLEGLPRPVKQVIHILVDVSLVPFCLYFAYALRLDSLKPFPMGTDPVLMFVLMTVVGAVASVSLKLHKTKLHSLETSILVRLVFLSAFLLFSFVTLIYFGRFWAPRTVPLIFVGLYLLLTSSVRMLGSLFLNYMRALMEDSVAIAIYGAGAAGIQFISAIRKTTEFKVKALFDDNPALHGVMVAGLDVESPVNLENIVESRSIQRVILAIPSLSDSRRVELLAELQKLSCEVHLLPSIVDLLSGKTTDFGGRSVLPEDLLVREKVDLTRPDISRTYAGRVVLVTGAGGSIGSELCRQLMQCHPRKVVLFEQNECALYQLERELRSQIAGSDDIELVAFLGTIIDPACVRSAIQDHDVNTVLHTAAYKHVPLLEENELEGSKNNVLGTSVVVSEALAAKIERFILVSSDKAVRPTNIMGATKRFAELIVQNAQTDSVDTKFSIVRFGNVLGSSGSVVPLFQEQINAGGPVTVTHPQMTRYFMTIPEASSLVLLAGAYASGGDVFVLDMGEPVKINDLAKRLIELMGHQVKTDEKELGVAIKYVGLRPGEKMYEELFLDERSLIATPHQKIMRAQESVPDKLGIGTLVKEFESVVSARDRLSVRRFFMKHEEFFGMSEQKIKRFRDSG